MKNKLDNYHLRICQTWGHAVFTCNCGLTQELLVFEKSIREEYVKDKWIEGRLSGLIPTCPHCKKRHRCPYFPYKEDMPRPNYHWHSARGSAKDRGIEFTITREYVWEVWFRDEGWKLRRPSIDRIDPAMGYIPNNIQFIELGDNVRKGGIKKATTEAQRLAASKNISEFNFAHPTRMNRKPQGKHVDCSVEGCTSNTQAGGMCDKHYGAIRNRISRSLPIPEYAKSLNIAKGYVATRSMPKAKYLSKNTKETESK